MAKTFFFFLLLLLLTHLKSVQSMFMRAELGSLSEAAGDQTERELMHQMGINRSE